MVADPVDVLPGSTNSVHVPVAVSVTGPDVHAAAAASAFGRFAYAADRSELWVEHAILGDDLDPVELETAIDAVARLSDGEDDRLQAAHGGSRYADLTGG